MLIRFLLRVLETLTDFLVALVYVLKPQYGCSPIIYPFEQLNRLDEADLPDPADDDISRMELYDRLLLGFADELTLTFSPNITGQRVSALITSQSAVFDFHELEVFECICLRLRGEFINQFNLEAVMLYQKGYTLRGILDRTDNCWKFARSLHV